MTNQLQQRAAHNGLTRHIFRYKVGDLDEGCIFDDECSIDHVAPMDAGMIEDYWSEIAEINHVGFKRGEVEIIYPFCYLEHDWCDFFFL